MEIRFTSLEEANIAAAAINNGSALTATVTERNGSIFVTIQA